MSLLTRLLGEPEVIGPPDCPIIHRWTLKTWGGWIMDPTRDPPDPEKKIREGPKLLLHRFPAFSDDRDVHDHPWPFWTFVLRGGYDDLAPCGYCVDGQARIELPMGWNHQRELEEGIYRPIQYRACAVCGGRGVVLNERMRAGMLRRRPADHRHRTLAHARGAWTLVLTLRVRRGWGFWRRGAFWPYRKYEEKFGFAMRCEDLPLEDRLASASAPRG